MVDIETLSLTEAIRLQSELSTYIDKKFQRHAALIFSDIVGSTPYFARFGNEAGRSLQQRHLDHLTAWLPIAAAASSTRQATGPSCAFPKSSPPARR